ncbi:hypothetical protein BW721_05780 [Jeotgalibaca sp. PTS2502]|nr:hypothetical protein BW721_05780 [Jeotgalibaca sp. PTS2502]
MRLQLHNIKKYLLIFLSLIVFYLVSLFIVYSLPNETIQRNYEDSLMIIEREGDYPLVSFGGTTAARLDNFTDRVMLQGTIKDEKVSILKASHNVRNYPRYWHGYQLFLRPLLLVMGYANIRYINMFFILTLLILAFSDIKKRLGTLDAFSFLLSMAMIYVVIFPMSMQFTTSFAVAMLAILGVGQLAKHQRMEELGYLFFISGSVVNFVDFLTYPLITLGLPLVYSILLKNKYEKDARLSNNLQLVISSSFIWGIAYAFTWVSKWILSSLILQKNVLGDAIGQAAFRTTGSSETVEVSALRALQDNFELMFAGPGFKLALVFFLFWLITWLFFHKPLKESGKYVPLLLISVFPYFWYIVLANHSVFHYWFTYRNQAVTVFAILSFLVALIDLEKLKNFLLYHRKISSR